MNFHLRVQFALLAGKGWERDLCFGCECQWNLLVWESVPAGRIGNGNDDFTFDAVPKSESRNPAGQASEMPVPGPQGRIAAVIP
jgi:hypothetical protein